MKVTMGVCKGPPSPPGFNDTAYVRKKLAGNLIERSHQLARNTAPAQSLPPHELKSFAYTLAPVWGPSSQHIKLNTYCVGLLVSACCLL